ncbi:MAG: DUF4870 domain-containing protein [Bacillus sp. (in: firmicutes)]
MSSKDDRLWACLIYVVSLFFPIIGPLLIWLFKKDQSEFVNYHAKEYLNFFISYAIYGIVAGLSTIILIGIVLVPIVSAVAVIFTILAAVKAYGGEEYRIPLIIRFIQ